MNILVFGTSQIISPRNLFPLLSMDCDQNEYYEVSTVNERS